MIELSDGIAIGALIISLISLMQNYKYSKKQEEVLLLEKRLNAILIQKEEEEQKNKLQADIKARYYQTGKNNRRLKVWNDGNGVAKNVYIVKYENSPLIPSDIESKFPLDLESKQNVDLLASVSLDTASKHQLKIRWQDENGKEIEKTLTLTI